MGNRKVILVADDEVMIRNMIRTYLHKAGYEVLAAADGEEALSLSRAHAGAIDLIVSDVDMPNLDGISAYLQVCTGRPGTKVLFMSGRGRAELELPEPWPLLRKPFQLAVLLTKVQDILNDDASRKVEKPEVILVVDHNENRKRFTKKVLLENGYAVLTASSVEEAEVLSARVKRIDLIISEVMFAGDSGVNLAERVASDRNIDTLLISHVNWNLLNNVPGFSRQEEFLANPFTAEDLLMRVRQLLQPSR